MPAEAAEGNIRLDREIQAVLAEVEMEDMVPVPVPQEQMVLALAEEDQEILCQPQHTAALEGLVW
jgi:hypothetical protein